MLHQHSPDEGSLPARAETDSPTVRLRSHRDGGIVAMRVEPDPGEAGVIPRPPEISPHPPNIPKPPHKQPSSAERSLILSTVPIQSYIIRNQLVRPVENHQPLPSLIAPQ